MMPSAGRIVVLANGEPPSVRLLRSRLVGADRLIACDGAANWLASIGVPPDIVLGDFDSLDPHARTLFAHAQFRHAPDQEANDLEKAARYALELGAGHVEILGGLGDRWDQSLATLSLMVALAPHVRVTTYTDTTEIHAVSSRVELDAPRGATLSVATFDDATGVFLTGVRWPLTRARLGAGSRGVSNEVTAPPVHVRVERGTLLVTLSRSGD